MGCGCNGGGQMAVAGKVGSSVRVFELCDEQTFEALVQDTGSNFANWTQHVLTRPDFERLGPAVEDMVVHAVGTNYDSFFRYNAVLQWRWKNGDWTDASANFYQTNRSTGAYAPSQVLANRADFGMQTRIVLRCAYAAGGAVGNRADLSLAVAVRFFCT